MNIEPGTCVCTKCGKEKDEIHFPHYHDRITRNGYRLRINKNCHSCSSEEREAIRYSRLRYATLYPKPEPGSPCACCQKPTDKFQYDHDHITGAFRGWLCHPCNVGLGKFDDNSRGVLNALLYLLRADEGLKVEALKEIQSLIEQCQPEEMEDLTVPPNIFEDCQ